MDLEENVKKYNKLNGCIKRYFGKNRRKEVKLRMHSVMEPEVSSPCLQVSGAVPYS
jgi:hypothetical protein